tara:strand:- start:8568 stop:8780 length:213 start_codon:yes stop_codon:yes gene_type:complete
MVKAKLQGRCLGDGARRETVNTERASSSTRLNIPTAQVDIDGDLKVLLCLEGGPLLNASKRAAYGVNLSH